MRYDGYIEVLDRPHEVHIEGSIVYPGYIEAIDRSHDVSISGYIVSDSTTLSTDQTFTQGAIISSGDMTLSLKDWTYTDGSQNPDGTWVDGTFQFRWFDPEWVFYSIYYYQNSDWSLVGYKYRDPVRSNVGEYYSSMVIPEETGLYENRWTYQRDSSSYAHEIIQPFTSYTRGIDSMPPDST